RFDRCGRSGERCTQRVADAHLACRSHVAAARVSTAAAHGRHQLRHAALMAEERFDAIVVGSGFAGAVTACRLSEAGLRVCVLERGRRYANVDLPVLPDETFWPRTEDDHVERKLPDFARAVWQLGQGLWELRDLGELLVAQAAGFGGGSLVYANVHLRAPT